MGGDRLGGGDPAAAAGNDQPQLAFDRPGLGEQRLDLRFQRAAVELELDRGGGAAEAVEVVDQSERLAVVEPDHLEGAVAPVETVVLHGDGRLGGRGDRPVDAGQLFEALAHSGRGYLVAIRGGCESRSDSGSCAGTSAPPIRS